MNLTLSATRDGVGANPGPERAKRLNIRIPKGDTTTRKRLKKAARTVNVSESSLVLAAINAVCDFVEEHKAITLPIKLHVVAGALLIGTSCAGALFRTGFIL